MSGEVQLVPTINATGEKVVYSYPSSRYTDPSREDGRRARRGKGKKTFQVAEMWDNHHEIARRLLLGQKATEIAQEMNCSETHISQVRNSPVVQDKLSIMRAARDAGTIDLAREIADLAPIAVQRIREALESGTVLGRELNGAGILKECNSLLDREMGKAVQRVDTRGIHTHLTGEDLERIKARAKELAPVGED
jgi:hypothetical protein